MSDKRKARIRALMAELNISYQAADNLLKGEAQRAARATAESPSEAAADQVATAVPLASVDPFLHDERLRDPTAIISTGLKAWLERAWPGLRVDSWQVGLFAGDKPAPATGRVFASHSLEAHVPLVNGKTKVRVEVRTGERRRATSTYRVWVWIGNRAHPALDRRVDLLDATVTELLADIVEGVEARVPNSTPLVPGQQLRFAVENQWFRLGSGSSLVTLQSPTLREQDDRVGPSGQVTIVRTLPLVLGAIRQVDGEGGPVPSRCYQGPLYVDDTDASWADATAGGLVPWLRRELGDHCLDVELLGAREHNRINVRAHFRVPRAA